MTKRELLEEKIKRELKVHIYSNCKTVIDIIKAISLSSFNLPGELSLDISFDNFSDCYDRKVVNIKINNYVLDTLKELKKPEKFHVSFQLQVQEDLNSLIIDEAVSLKQDPLDLKFIEIR